MLRYLAINGNKFIRRCELKYKLVVSIVSTHTAVEVVFAHDLLDPLGRGPDERRGVQVVQLVEVEEGGEVREDLVPDPVPEHHMVTRSCTITESGYYRFHI